MTWLPNTLVFAPITLLEMLNPPAGEFTAVPLPHSTLLPMTFVEVPNRT